MKKYFLTSNISIREKAFSPLDILNLSLWYDGNDLSTLSLDGSNNVSQWLDKSGNTRHSTQGTSGNRPFYNITDNRVQFNGVNEFLNFDGTFLAGSNYTIFVHQSQSGIKNNNYFLGAEAPSPSQDRGLILAFFDANTVRHAHFGYGIDATVSQPLNTEILYTFHFDISNNNGKQGKRVWRQDTELSTYIIAGSSTPISLISNNNATLGGWTWTGIGNSYYNGEIAEVIMYDRALTDSEITKVQNYIFSKWI